MMDREDIDLGKTGAKQQSWQSHNARTLLREIVEANPAYDEEQIYHAMMERAAPYYPEIMRYWVTNTLKSLRKIKKGESTADRAASEERASRIKERIDRIMLLDMRMPNGKMLRDCTFGEAGHFGGWLVALSKSGQPGEIIGATMTEKQVRAVLRR